MYDLTEAEESHFADLLKPQATRGNLPSGRAVKPECQPVRSARYLGLESGGHAHLLEAVKAAALQPRPARDSRQLGRLLRQPCPGAACRSRKTVRYDPTTPTRRARPRPICWGSSTILSHGTEAIMVRPFNHAGPRQSPTYVLAALAHQVAEVRGRAKAQVEVGNLDVVRDFTDVRDVVARLSPSCPARQTRRDL